MPGLQVHFEVLNQLNSPALYADTLANRPVAQLVGRIFFRTDSPFGLYRDTGSAWDLIANVDTNAVTGSGATGQVTYFSSANVIAGNNNLFWDSTNNRLGINTATPGVALDIHGTGTITQFNGTGTSNSFVNFQNAGTGKWRVGNNYSGATNYFSIFDQTNSVETLKITPGATNSILFTGNLTATTLIKSGGTSAQILAADGSVITAGTNITISGGTISSSGGGGVSIGDTITGGTSGSVLFINSLGALSQANVDFYWNNTLKRLGIGDASPSYRLDVLNSIGIKTLGLAAASLNFSNTGIDAAADCIINITTNNGTASIGKKSPGATTSGMIIASDTFVTNASSGDIVLTNTFSTGKLRFGAGGATTAQATLTAAGRFLLGTTTESTYILDVNGNSRISGNLIFNGAYKVIYFGSDTSNAYIVGANSDGLYFNASKIEYSISTSKYGRFQQISGVTSFLIGDDGTAGGRAAAASSILELYSKTQGFLPPRMTTTQKNAISSPAQGLMVFDTTLIKLCVYSGTSWETITSV
jgi:hypothetical protein